MASAPHGILAEDRRWPADRTVPSPIAHTAAAWAIWRASTVDDRRGRELGGGIGDRALLLFTAVICLLPDSTSVVGLLAGNLGRYHNNLEHSLLVGVAVAAAVAALATRWLARWRFRRWFAVTLLAYESHLVMDYFTIGRGLKLFWPISAARWKPPFELFYGFHWSDGWLTPRHLWTAATEIAFAGLLVLAMSIWLRRSGRR